MIDQLVIPSNPTPNGDLHIGHIAGPFIGADALRRAAESRGEHAAVLLGTAWQNTHVMLAAREQGRDYLAVAGEFTDRIERSFAAANIEYEVMLRHHDIPLIEQATRQAWSRLRGDGVLVVRDAAAQYCPACQAWRFQGFVAGSCPHCGSTDASGIDCEGCGIYHDDAELRDATCVVCAAPTELRPLRRAFLDLEPQRSWFERYLGGCTLGDPVREFAESVLARPLPSVAVSFNGELGIPADDPDLPGQRIYPAFELAPRYVAMTRKHRESGARYEPGRTRAGMLFGIDNAFERVFLFPAVLRGSDDAGVPVPDVLQLTYFALLDGAKFSTSRRHVVRVAELADVAGADGVRLYLAATRPEHAATNFTRAEFENSAEVATVRRLREWAATGSWPAGTAAGGGDRQSDLVAASSSLADALRPERLSCRRAARAIITLAELAGTADSDIFRDAALHCLVNGAVLIPETAARLAGAFGVRKAVFDGKPLPAGGGQR